MQKGQLLLVEAGAFWNFVFKPWVGDCRCLRLVTHLHREVALIEPVCLDSCGRRAPHAGRLPQLADSQTQAEPALAPPLHPS